MPDNPLFGAYVHHDRLVAVRQELQGKHWEYCLCKHCGRFMPDDEEKHCPIAKDTLANCKKHGLVTPVWECPSFTVKL